MTDIYSPISIKKLKSMKVASYRNFSLHPEEEAIAFMDEWLKKQGLNHGEDMRRFGFDVPVGEDQKNQGIRGYEYMVTVPLNTEASGGVIIKDVDEDDYAVLTIKEPFRDAFSTIPKGWKRLMDWVMGSEYKTTCFNNRYCLEEVIEKEEGTYMDIYFPVKDGGRKSEAKLIDFTTKQLNPYKVIGKEIRCIVGHPEGNPIPPFWDELKRTGIMEQLEGHPDRLYGTTLIGWMGDYNPTDQTFSYVVGILAKPDAVVPEDMFTVNMPSTRYAVGRIYGTEPEIYMNAHSLTVKQMEKAGLKYNDEVGVEIEWYGEEFCPNQEDKIFDLYIPIL